MNFYKPKNYQRKYLRAPYQEELLIQKKNTFFKVKATNLSDGGFLIRCERSLFDLDDDFFCLLKVPRFPYFKNFSFEKIKTYSRDLLSSKVIRVQARVVRFQIDPEDFSFALFGIEIKSISPYEKEVIKDYVGTFSSNLIYLQVLLGLVNSRPDKEDLIRELASILGYNSKLKMALLNKITLKDYRSLQWL